jgi:hypothetical protein
MRGIRTPYRNLSEVDPVTGLLFLQDKKSPSKKKTSGYKTRLVWLPPFVREQMQYYREHLEALRLPTTKPCFFVDPKEQNAVEVRPKTLALHLAEFLPLPANVHRRLLRTQLLKRRCPPEMIDALLGHWHRGEEPWGEYSSFCYATYRQLLAQFLEPLLQDLGFCAIRSRKS